MQLVITSSRSALSLSIHTTTPCLSRLTEQLGLLCPLFSTSLQHTGESSFIQLIHSLIHLIQCTLSERIFGDFLSSMACVSVCLCVMCVKNYGRIREPGEVVKAKSRLILLGLMFNYALDVIPFFSSLYDGFLIKELLNFPLNRYYCFHLFAEWLCSFAICIEYIDYPHTLNQRRWNRNPTCKLLQPFADQDVAFMEILPLMECVQSVLKRHVPYSFHVCSL